MSGAEVLLHATTISLALLCLALLLALIRLLKGPTLADRVLALDLLTTLGLGFIGVIALRSGETIYLDLAIALGLVGFLATVAFARYMLHRGRAAERRANAEGEGQ